MLITELLKDGETLVVQPRRGFSSLASCDELP